MHINFVPSLKVVCRCSVSHFCKYGARHMRAQPAHNFVMWGAKYATVWCNCGKQLLVCLIICSRSYSMVCMAVMGLAVVKCQLTMAGVAWETRTTAKLCVESLPVRYFRVGFSPSPPLFPSLSLSLPLSPSLSLSLGREICHLMDRLCSTTHCTMMSEQSYITESHSEAVCLG